MRRALSYFEGMTAKRTFPYDDRYWLFLDWADIFKDGYPTVYNMFYFWTLETAASSSASSASARTPRTTRRGPSVAARPS